MKLILHHKKLQSNFKCYFSHYNANVFSIFALISCFFLKKHNEKKLN